jgi:hypothetical protein
VGAAGFHPAPQVICQLAYLGFVQVDDRLDIGAAIAPFDKET